MTTETQEAQQPTSFKDLDGREWRIVLRPSALERLRELHAVDLWDASNTTETGPHAKLADERELVAALWCILEKAAESKGISKESFFDAFAGDVFVDARAALHGALLVFFSGARRSILRLALAELTARGEKEVAFAKELQEGAQQNEQALFAEAKAKFLEEHQAQARAKIPALVAMAKASA